jgi:C-terminal peptidase prc
MLRSGASEMVARNSNAVLPYLRRLAGIAGTAETDRELLERFHCRGDQAAFATLVERHGSLVWRVCRQGLPRTQDAEDVFQATFLVLLRKAGTVRWRTSIAGWLFQVARRLACEARCRAARRKRHETQAVRSSVSNDSARRELAAILDEELDRLPDPYRAPLLLCYLEGLTSDQAARQLGWSLRTLERRLNQGRTLLRRRLSQNGISLSAALLAPKLTHTAKTIASLPLGSMPASAEAFALADAFVKGVFMTRLKTLAVLALVLTMTAGVGALIQRGLAGGGTTNPSPAIVAPPADAEQRPEVKALANRAWTIMDVVGQRHLEPCPRPTMISAGIQALCRAAKREVPADIERRSAAITTPAQLAALLDTVWPQGDPTPRQAIEKALLDGVLQRVPGKAQLATPPDPKELRVQEQSSNNRYVGVGIMLKIDEQSKRTVLVSAMLRGAARQAGLKAGDVFEAVDGKDTKGVPIAKVVDWLRGDEGTSVTVTVRTPGSASSRPVTMTRAKVPFEHIFGMRRISEEEYDFRVDPQAPIAYVRVGGLVSSTLAELRRYEQKLRAAGFRALVLDLRFGRGGSFAHAALLGGGLLDGGLLWSVQGSDNQERKEYRAERECLFRDWPIVVLVDRSLDTSYSLVAAALQDNCRAVLVGEPSAMDGYVKSMVPLPGEKDSLILPTGRVTRAVAGHGWPVQPDHVVAMSKKEFEAAAEWARQQEISDRAIDLKAQPPADPQMAKAVQLLRESLQKAPALPQGAAFKSTLRQPIAMVLSDDGTQLFTANQRSGTVSVIDPSAGRCVAEVAVGHRLADLASLPDGRGLLAVDERAGELVLLRRQVSGLEVEQRLAVGSSPASVQVSGDGTLATVALLWPRQLITVMLDGGLRVARMVDLPFAPRLQRFVDKNRLVVADAFGGQLAVVDVARGVLESARTIPGHNVRGLAMSADGGKLWVSEQALNSLGHAQYDDIHWGNLITNNLRVLRRSAILDPKADLLSGSNLLYLGDAGHGTGDPAGVVLAVGRFAVALSGVGEIALGDPRGENWHYVPVGRRPTAIVASKDGNRLYVANTFSDSVSVVDPQEGKQLAEITLGPSPELSASERGERLFHDARLAHDGWLSCHSCHTDGHSSGRLADTLSDGSYGTPKRILSLRGVGDTGPWAWNGHVLNLENQIQASIESTMQGKKATPAQVADLTAYLKTLPPAPPHRAAGADIATVQRGEAVFEKQGCGQCHQPPLYTTAKSYDVGLIDEAGNKHFNPPSLRGISQGGPYFHDGRATTLADVLTRYRHRLKSDLTPRELTDLLAFLSSV